MLSKKFFDSAFEGSTENEGINNNNVTTEIDRRNGIESTSTAISFLSSDSDIPKYGHQESPQLLRRRLDLEEEFDFGIPGAYR